MMAVSYFLDMVNDVADSHPAFIMTPGSNFNCAGAVYTFYQILYPLPRYRNGRDNRYAQQISKSLKVDMYSQVLNIVPHIQGYYHWDALFQKLQGQVEVPFQVGGINHIDNHVAGFKHFQGHFFCFRSGFECISSGDINNCSRFLSQLHKAFGKAHCRAGIIGSDDMHSGQARENNAFANVGIAHEQYLFNAAQFTETSAASIMTRHLLTLPN